MEDQAETREKNMDELHEKARTMLNANIQTEIHGENYYSAHKIEFHVEEPLKKPPREMLLLGVRPTRIERFQAADYTKWQVVSKLLQMLNLEEVVDGTRWHMQEMHELISSKIFQPKVEETNRDEKI